MCIKELFYYLKEQLTKSDSKSRLIILHMNNLLKEFKCLSDLFENLYNDLYPNKTSCVIEDEEFFNKVSKVLYEVEKLIPLHGIKFYESNFTKKVLKIYELKNETLLKESSKTQEDFINIRKNERHDIIYDFKELYSYIYKNLEKCSIKLNEYKEDEQFNSEFKEELIECIESLNKIF